MALRAAARKLADLERESRKRALVGSHQPTKHFFDPRKKKSAYCEFVHRAGGVDFYRPLPVRSAAGGNSALRPVDEASRAKFDGFLRALLRKEVPPRPSPRPTRPRTRGRYETPTASPFGESDRSSVARAKLPG